MPMRINPTRSSTMSVRCGGWSPVSDIPRATG
jgi:hypothetical protein